MMICEKSDFRSKGMIGYKQSQEWQGRKKNSTPNPALVRDSLRHRIPKQLEVPRGRELEHHP